MAKDLEILKDGLREVYWLSGMSRSGKSTSAEIIANWYGFKVHHRDDAIQSHFKLAETYPELYPETGKMKEVIRGIEPGWSDYFKGSVDSSMKSYLSWLREDWSMTIQDLADSLSDFTGTDTPYIIEGHRLPPEGVVKLLSAHHRAVWLAPSRSVVEQRLGGWRRMSDKFSDPVYGKRKVIDLFHGASESLVAGAEGLNLGVVRVDVEDTPEEIAERVSRHYRLQSP